MKTAIINYGLEKDIYMSQLERCVAPRQENKVYKVRKFLYGQKQTP